MANSIMGLTVVFDTDVRPDEADAIIYAINMIKGVSHVAKIDTHAQDYINRSMIKSELVGKLYEVLK